MLLGQKERQFGAVLAYWCHLSSMMDARIDSEANWAGYAQRS